MKSLPETTCDALARAFAYPGTGWPEAMRQAAAAVGPDAAGTRQRLERFLAGLEALPAAEREELFTRTFDLNPECALEVGWHLYGENYERGAFLVWLRARAREIGIESGRELPDHLTHILALLGRLPSAAAAPLVGATQAALDRILAKSTDETNPYLGALRAVRSLLEVSGLGAASTPAAGGATDA